MWSSHGCPAGKGITTVAGIICRTRVSAGSSNIRFSATASISRDRAAAAKASDRIRAGSQSSDRVGSLIKRWRIGDSGTRGAGITRSNYHLDTSSFLSFNSSLQFVADNTTLRDRAGPGIDCNMGCFSRVAFVRRAANRIRRQKEFHALHICRRCAVALVHVTACNPFCAGRHADLVGPAIVPNRGAGRVRTMEEIITRLWRVRAANAAAGMNRIMPAKIVIRVDSVPAAVMRLERVMCPANTGIRTGNHDGLPLESERPDIWRVRVSNPRLNRHRRRRAAGSQRRLFDRTSLRKVIVNKRITCNPRHIRASSQRVGNLTSAFHKDRINDIKRLMLDFAVTQPLQDRLLRTLGLLQQGLINEAALFRFSLQIGSRA